MLWPARVDKRPSPEALSCVEVGLQLEKVSIDAIRAGEQGS